jgi:hypothetical protein
MTVLGGSGNVSPISDKLEACRYVRLKNRGTRLERETASNRTPIAVRDRTLGVPAWQDVVHHKAHDRFALAAVDG